MTAILTVLLVSVVTIILSYNIYCIPGKKYQRIGINLFRAVLGVNFCYWSLVLVIGLAPLYN